LEVPGLAIDAIGQLYVVEGDNSKIVVLSSDGSFLDSFGADGSSDGWFHDPSGIALGQNGTLYVCETGNDRIQKFSYSTPIRQATWGRMKSQFKY
jgi:sugar lactone lactonase YvrE